MLQKNKGEATREKERKPRKSTLDVDKKDKRISGMRAWSTMGNARGSKVR